MNVAVGVVGLLLAGLIAPLSMTVAQAGPTLEPRSAPPTTTLAVIKVIGVGGLPTAVAVDQDDDTVYVANNDVNTVSVINGRTGLRTDDTITVGPHPQGVAVDQGDDTVYVTNFAPDTVSVINGRSRAVVSTIPVGTDPYGVAVNQDDDTVYVANTISNTVSVINGRTATEDDTISVGGEPSYGVAVNQDDDTVYVANTISNTVSVINGRSRAVVSTIPVGTNPYGVAVDQGDDTVYVANTISSNVSVINGRSATEVGPPIPVGSRPYGVAVDQADDTVYVANWLSNNVSVIDGRTGVRTDNIAVGLQPWGVAVDDSGTNQGLVYVTTSGANSVSVIGRVTPSSSPQSGDTGTQVNISVAVPQVAYDVDDATVTSVSFGGTPASGLTAAAGNRWTVTAPAATPGSTVPVTVTFRGGLTASAGTFTYNAAPLPPAFPPSAPLSVTGIAGDAEATVTWAAPASSGSFPITRYEVRSTPAGGTCLVATLTCTVTGLTNGTAYTFEARALNGAGWGPWSTPSNAVTPTAPPTPSITITGSRGTGADRQIVFVTGTSTGLDGEQVRAHVKFRGQADYRPGRLVDVSAEGRFDWKRTTGKKTYVYFTGGGVNSNRVIIPAARR